MATAARALSALNSPFIESLNSSSKLSHLALKDMPTGSALTSYPYISASGLSIPKVTTAGAAEAAFITSFSQSVFKFTTAVRHCENSFSLEWK